MKSQRILEAVKNETSRIAAYVDSMPGLRAVSFVVKLKPNGDVRAVIVTTETSTDTDNGAG
jgi:hypothetical protein